MMDTARTPRRLPMSPAAGAALVVAAAVLGGLAAGTLLLHGTLTAHTLVTVSGAIFGMSLVFLLFRKVGLGGSQITWATFGLVLGVLTLFAAGPFLLSQYAPGNDLAAVAMGLLVAATTLAAGVAVARIEAAARGRARDDVARDLAEANGGDASYPATEPGAYSAADALADIADTRAGLADAATTPAWYHPLIALALAALMIALGVDMSGAAMMAIEIPAIALIIAVIIGYRRTAGMWFTQPARGTRAFRLWIVLMVVVAGCLAAALLARYTGAWWLAVISAIVVLVAYVVLGRGYDEAFRADLRDGSRPARDQAVRGADR